MNPDKDSLSSPWPRFGFWAFALLWLPIGVLAVAFVRFGVFGDHHENPGAWLRELPMSLGSLIPVAPCGIPLAVACRTIWRWNYRRTARGLALGLGFATVAVTPMAGLLGPAGIAAYSVSVSVPAWLLCWVLRHRRKGTKAGNGTDMK